LRFHFKEAGADAKLIQLGPLGVAYHCRHPKSTVPVARITAHVTVSGLVRNKFLETSLLETSLLETSLLETSLLETSLLETSMLETSMLETSLLETSLFQAN
jgi:hypothetical protein